MDSERTGDDGDDADDESADEESRGDDGDDDARAHLSDAEDIARVVVRGVGEGGE